MIDQKYFVAEEREMLCRGKIRSACVSNHGLLPSCGSELLNPLTSPKTKVKLS